MRSGGNSELPDFTNVGLGLIEMAG